MKTFPTISYVAVVMSEALKKIKLEGERMEYIERCLRAVYQRGINQEEIDGEPTKK